MLFLYMEGLLDSAEHRQVEEYVAAHSEAQELLQLYDPQLTLPKELPLNGDDGKPLAFPGKESLYSTAMAATQKPTPQSATPVVPLSGSRQHNALRRTLSAAACAAVLLIFGIEILRHGGNPSFDNAPAIASLRDDMLQQGSTQRLALALAEAETQPTMREEPLQYKEPLPVEHRNIARADLDIEELQAIAEALQSTRNMPYNDSDHTISIGDSDYPEDIAPLLAEMQNDRLPQNSFDMPGEVLIVDDVVVYYDSLSFAEQVWSRVLSDNPQLAFLSQQWESRTQNEEHSNEQNEGNILQRIAHRLGWERKTNIKTAFNNLGEYLAQVDNLKQTSMKWIADGADTLSQRFTTFAKNTLQDERIVVRRKP